MNTGSAEPFLRHYETYARSPIDKLNMLPKMQGDFRERVPRETLRGRYAIFHESIEMYLYRHWRAYTCPRVAVFWFGSFALMQHATISFNKTFPNLSSYRKFSQHPNYKVMGVAYSYFYLARVFFWTYITARMTLFMYGMIKRHWEGRDDQHYFWYYDTLYPDLLHDADDMRYINFRYTDQKVSPDSLTGYYPYAHTRYSGFLNQKYDNTMSTQTGIKEMMEPK